MESPFLEFVIERGAPADWRQCGSDYISHRLAEGASAADALREVAVLPCLKFTLPVRDADGALRASRHVEIGPAEVADVRIGAVWTVAFREGFAAGRRGEPAPEQPRKIGFH